MTKNICTLLILFSTLINYSQNSILFKNNNPKAKALKHDLNHAKDSLILSSETKILQIEIFNEDYEKLVKVEGFESQISLADIPEGKFVIEARLEDKNIVMGLMRYDYADEGAYSKTATKENIAEGKGMMLDESLNVIRKTPNKSIEFLLTGSSAKRNTEKKQKFYWVLTKVNSESGSSKTMRLVSKDGADRMILKHKLELNSISGKHNELTVWEVYNSAKFMEYQMLNPDFFYSLYSDLFNTTPYYITENTLQNL